MNSEPLFDMVWLVIGPHEPRFLEGMRTALEWEAVDGVRGACIEGATHEFGQPGWALGQVPGMAARLSERHSWGRMEASLKANAVDHPEALMVLGRRAEDGRMEWVWSQKGKLGRLRPQQATEPRAWNDWEQDLALLMTDAVFETAVSPWRRQYEQVLLNDEIGQGTPGPSSRWRL